MVPKSPPVALRKPQDRSRVYRRDEGRSRNHCGVLPSCRAPATHSRVFEHTQSKSRTVRREGKRKKGFVWPPRAGIGCCGLFWGQRGKTRTTESDTIGHRYHPRPEEITKSKDHGRTIFADIVLLGDNFSSFGPFYYESVHKDLDDCRAEKQSRERCLRARARDAGVRRSRFHFQRHWVWFGMRLSGRPRGCLFA